MNPWIHLTGWTLIHFVWQASIVALVTAAGLRIARHQSSEVRYAIACAGLATMIIAAALTAAWVSGFNSVQPSDNTILAGLSGSGVATGVRVIAGSSSDFATVAGRTVVSLDAVLPFVVWGWFAGVMTLLTRLAGGCWRIHRLRTLSLREASSSWQPCAERLAQRLRVAVRFRVVESTLVTVPLVIGWMRPIVLLPVAALVNLAPAQIEAIIAHELAHVRRRDYLVNLVQTGAEAVFFFHPAVWWVSSRMRAEREHCCDDVAVEVCREPASYAEALTELAAWRMRDGTLSIGAADGSLLTRVRRLVGVPDEEPSRAVGGVVMLASGVVFAAAVVVTSSSAFAVNTTDDRLVAQSSDERRTRNTDHFEIHYPPDLDLHADRVAREAERAYEQISGDLKHNLAFRIPIVLYHTSKELEQSVQRAPAVRLPGALPADASRDRILFAVDRPADQWLGDITHEVAHVFGFDILPDMTTVWIFEGLAEYQRGAWDPSDLVALRDVVRANAIPKMSALRGDGPGGTSRLVSGLGHAAFDFIETRWGKPGVRQFLFALRQTTRNGGDPYQAAFRVGRDEFDVAFERYLTDRFARVAELSPAERFDAASSVRVEGIVTSIRSAMPPGLACIELWVAAEGDIARRWAVECGDRAAQDLLRWLRPGDRVVITGAPARETGSRRLLIQRVFRPSDGFTWG